ncbi:hypothetical protein JW977_04250 [Candidatus Falkowbacteria bacterium]|nr:hypothetical protein [Candidatus Falkowbacteria bacterium]
MARIIGIRHRIKQTKDRDPKPTQICILHDGKEESFALATEQDELDFVRGVLPVSYRNVEADEDLNKFATHQIIGKALKKGEEKGAAPNLVFEVVEDKKKVKYLAEKVPSAYDGLHLGDSVAMVLGGSGDYFAYALSRRGEEVGAKVYRVPPSVLKAKRPEKSKDDDAKVLAMLLQNEPGLFYQILPKDRNLIRLRIAYRGKVDAMKARIACGQRLLQFEIGQIFTNEQGHFPEGSLEKQFAEKQNNDPGYQVLEAEEAKLYKEICKCLEELTIYKQLFQPIQGCGPMIASRLICAIQDIRRFSDEVRLDGKIKYGAAKLKSFCGVGLDAKGRFMRRRAGEVANFNPDARQALYLLGDQMNRRPDSEWGQRLRENKVNLRNQHPDVLCKVCGNGTKWADCPDQKKHTRIYSDGHIHKMAIWRTLSEFVEHLYHEWWNLEGGAPRVQTADKAVNE